MTSLRWIDTHVHLFTPQTAGDSPAMIHGGINSVETYVSRFGAQKPAGAVIVDFSKAESSAHVMATLPLLTKAGIPARGIIRANVQDERTFEWIAHPQVAGARMYALAELPDMSDKAKWDKFFTLLRAKRKHLSLFGSPALLRKLIAALPGDITLLIDHLGMPKASEGENQYDFAQLLADCAARQKSGQAIYFKGPGYRTSFEVNKVTSYLHQIIRKLGESQLLLGASDAPFAGPVVETGGKFSGKNNQDFIGYATILPYLNQLIEKLAQDSNKSFEILQMQLLYSNAQKLYQFEEAEKAAAA